LSLNVPLIEANHLVGHIYSLFIDKAATFPLGVLLVSGGHTMILEVDKNRALNVLAATYDDSFGESFDKVAKMMNLGYPGGVKIEQIAKNADKKRFKFTIPLLHDARSGYSFSGLKNQVRVKISKIENINDQDRSDIAYAFEEAAIAHIMNKLEKIFKTKKFKTFGAVGGASANLKLRSKLQELCKSYNSELILAPMKFCSDNAAMIARVGVEKYIKKEFINYQDIKISPRVNLDGLQI
jgi:N6-L-threonylcarbamoyladenine synthase